MAWEADVGSFGHDDDVHARAKLLVVPVEHAPGLEPHSSEGPAGNLPPPLTSFVGREDEVVELSSLLSGEARLVTLTGPGGCGKTRLAFAVAERLAGRNPDGVWATELAPLSDPTLVPRGVASVLGVSEQPGRPLRETLEGRIGRLRMLLLLDNCEHLLDACAGLVWDLLRNCPKVRILATSREPLGVSGELVRTIPPLTVPGIGDRPDDVSRLSRYGSVRLFVERATEALPSFSLNKLNAEAVSRVCRDLDGIPLAIELAAARVKVLDVGGIAARLDDSLGLLTMGAAPRSAPDRHRTLRAALDWSYDLLGEQERGFFEQLAVFAGGFSLEAAEAVCNEKGTNTGALDLLHGLTEKSLVVVETGECGVVRYGLLETVRQYGLDRLRSRGEIEAARGRHSAYYVRLAEEAEPKMRGREQLHWSARLEAEHDNFRAALGWARDGGGRAADGLRLAAALWRYWDACGHLNEGYRWLVSLLATGQGTPRVRARALDGAGWLGIFQGNYQGAIADLQESLAISRGLRDLDGAATVLCHLMMAGGNSGDLELCKSVERQMDELLPDLGRSWAKADLLLSLALAAMNNREYASMADLFSRSLALSEEVGFNRGVTMSLVCWGLGRIPEGDLEGAADLLKRALPMLREGGDKLGLAYVIWGLGGVASRRNEPARAARLWGAAESLREFIGLPLSEFARSDSGYEEQISVGRSLLGEDAWGSEWKAGRELTLDEALEYALDAGGASEKHGTNSGTYPAGLTPREVEVLRPVARGLTNAQVAEELYITPRTVNGHLTSIYRKLGVTSRAAASSFAADNGLLGSPEIGNR